MKTIRRISKSRIPLMFTLLSFLLFSCGKDSVNSELNQISGKEFMQGIFFLDGVVVDNIKPLNDLKLVDLFEIDQISEVRNHIDILLNKIEDLHPGTFESFKLGMTSGNHLIISESIVSTAKLIFNTIEEINKDDYVFMSVIENEQPLVELVETYFPSSDDEFPTALEVKGIVSSDDFKNSLSTYFNTLDDQIRSRNANSEENMCVVIAAAVVVVASIAIAVIYAVAILAAVVVAGAFWIVKQSLADFQRSDSSLLREQIVNSIAVQFVPS